MKGYRTIVKVRKRGNGRFSLHWRDQTDCEKTEFIGGDISIYEAWKIAGKKELSLELGSVEPLKWDVFVRRFREFHISRLGENTATEYLRHISDFGRTVQPETIHITADSIAKYTNDLMARNISIQTIKTSLSVLRVALRWAQKMGYIEQVPAVEIPRDERGSDCSKGRPLTPKEILDFLDAIPKIRRLMPERFVRIANGILLSGLRLSEALRLQWNDTSAPHSLEDRNGTLFFVHRVQKGRRQSTIPAMPDFAEFIRTEFPDYHGRLGEVFEITTSVERVSRYFSSAGKAAGIIVSETSGNKMGRKYASAHDLRRTFAARWAEVLPESVLAALMRHRSPDTTRKHYAIMDAERILHAVEEAFRKRNSEAR